MKLPLFWIDAFSARVFAGNPAAVVPLDRWPEDRLLQRIACEHGLSETAFFVRTGPARFHLRWFTPAVEVDLCGHATLASAYTLFAQLGQAGAGVTFDTRSGALTVTQRGDRLEMDFPAQPATPVGPDENLTRALGLAPVAVLRTQTRWLCCYATSADVIGLQPDHARLARLVPGRITITAPGTDCDFVSRTFVPDAGIAEDPVTGSAHCTLVPYWAERLGRTALHARQVSARGGELWCELRPPTAADRGETRVKIAGHAVLYLRGEISVES